MAITLQQIQLPTVNGFRTDHSSTDLKVNGRSYFYKSVSLTGSVEPGEVRGNAQQVMGATRGNYKATGSFELWSAESEACITDLMSTHPNTGLLDITFPVFHIIQPEGGLPAIVRNAPYCRIIEDPFESGQGNTPHAVKFNLFVWYILHSNYDPITGLYY
jgi:hypothetical protein